MTYGASALPPIDQTAIPAEVRNGSAQDKKDYQAALGFESMLMNELTKTMVATARPVDGQASDGAFGDTSSDGSSSDDGTVDGQSSDAATSTYLDMLPGQLADSLMASGGTGLAKTFYDSLKERRS